jgi:putative methylase
MTLQGLEQPAQRTAKLEQYPTPSGLAAELLFLALAQGDIEGRGVVDLGCGNGILALGALLLGAASAVGFDVDPWAVEAGRHNARALGVKAKFVRADVREVVGRWDTAVMNPPFGSQRKHADLPFLAKALGVAAVTYSFHNSVTLPFLQAHVKRLGGRVTQEQRYKFPMAYLFPFHRKARRDFDVVLLRIEVG